MAHSVVRRIEAVVLLVTVLGVGIGLYIFFEHLNHGTQGQKST